MREAIVHGPGASAWLAWVSHRPLRHEGTMKHTARHRPFSGPETPAAQPDPAEAARGLSVTDRAFYRDGVGFVPVSGEIHYSRIPRARWAERLGQLRAAGITHASTYAFWNHHVPERGAPSFEDGLDVGAFIDECAAAGLEVVLRIGPWAHGEARNGGFPDWVQEAPVGHRTDDPAYLELVRGWFGQLATALAGRARPGGAIIAIQLENELYDQPGHLVTLKRLAREAGMAAPLWTATAWGSAQLPDGEVVPLFSGYADGFWADPAQGWDASFRAHFFPSHEWDDPGVGADVRAALGTDAVAAGGSPTDLHGFPPATCELGSGMATAYHRRPVLTALDIAALAHNKIGNGSAWQGFFMFAGGRNPRPGLQETIATGYPNDMPELGYDFHAPIGQSGDLTDTAAALREQHAFLAAFGGMLSQMPSTLPDRLPAGLDDTGTLRWALRSDGDAGFIVISHHQPYEPVDGVAGAQFEITLDDGVVTLPSQPVDIPSGTLARWPVGLRIGDMRVRWATASALTVLPGSRPTLVLVATAGVGTELALDDREPVTVAPGVFAADAADVLVLESSASVWVQESVAGRRMLRTGGELAFAGTGDVVRGAATVEEYDPASGTWQPVQIDAPDLPATEILAPHIVREAEEAPADYGFGGVRHRAPSTEAFDALAAVHRLDLPDWAPEEHADAVLEIDWAGDVAQLRVDGVPVDDRFWDGTSWSISLIDAGVAAGSVVTLHVLPLSARSTVWLPSASQARRSATDALAEVGEVRVRARGRWRPL
ncbi:hypothetical protein GCM10010460_03060 [Microbacterium terrae]|uniref:Beta-galactosidase n=2 Tax=Microbacterium terrae TaxID=69369 RepID=A0A0M2H452_9MICO|nr:Beta-galactosidase precursor [Microbacterium terrae]GLJ96869.1 hypothetical protein GCM10017594_00660 [Microbacterium terrae]